MLHKSGSKNTYESFYVSVFRPKVAIDVSLHINSQNKALYYIAQAAFIPTVRYSQNVFASSPFELRCYR